jgi:hypothetical protein
VRNAILILIAGLTAALPACSQTSIKGVSIYTEPARLSFFVDGQPFSARAFSCGPPGLSGEHLAALYAGRTNAAVGVDAVRFRLPATLGSGMALIKITVNGVESNTAFLPVEGDQ